MPLDSVRCAGSKGHLLHEMKEINSDILTTTLLNGPISGFVWAHSWRKHLDMVLYLCETREIELDITLIT